MQPAATPSCSVRWEDRCFEKESARGQLLVIEAVGLALSLIVRNVANYRCNTALNLAWVVPLRARDLVSAL